MRAYLAHPFVRHLRLHFNLLLSPVFLWGVLLAGGNLLDVRLWLGFLAVQVFLYGGATAFNSYFDRDEGPVGGMLEPPEVTPGLLPFALAVQAPGLALALVVGRDFTLAWLVLFLVFTAYSHPRIRLKAHPAAALAAIALGQGAVGCSLGWLTVAPAAPMLTGRTVAGMLSASLVVVGLYVVTQSYQTLEDGRRGDRTLPVLVGAKAALRLAVAVLGAGGVVMLGVLDGRVGTGWLAGVASFFALVAAWMLRWAAGFDERDVEGNYRSAMRLAALSSAGFTGVILAVLAGLT